ncbi:hypothetical protein EJB05_34487, partial [Eragrostis curvula]
MDDTISVAMDSSKKAYVVAVTIQLIYTGMFVISKAAFDNGINTFVFIFYRQAVGSLLLLPLALLLHRITFSLNMYHVSLKFTSATVASATDNSLPAVTFFIALLLRKEVVKLKSASGVAKVTGIVLCLAGVFAIAFYAGPSLSPVNHHRAFASHVSSAGEKITRGAWVKWTFLMVLANSMWSLWIVLQASVLNEYPDKILVTAVQCAFSAVQSFVAAVVAERDFSRWKLRFDISLLAIFYSVISPFSVAVVVVSGVCGDGSSLLPPSLVCGDERPRLPRGMDPALFHLHNILLFLFPRRDCPWSSGSYLSFFFIIVGGILLVGGLYSVLWGKSKEANVEQGKGMYKNNVPQDEYINCAEKNSKVDKEQGEATSTPEVEQV